MKLKIKEEYLDSFIQNPFTGKIEYVRIIDKDLYKYLYNTGLKHLFEEIITKKKK